MCVVLRKKIMDVELQLSRVDEFACNVNIHVNNFVQRKVVLPIIISDYTYVIACFPSSNVLCAWRREGKCLSWELWQVCPTEFPCEKIFFFLKVCVHACIFCKHVPYVCLHGLRVCIIEFSAWLAVPVCACVQVAHDPGSAGRSVSFMSSVQFSLKSGSKDERITLICYDTHTHIH